MNLSQLYEDPRSTSYLHVLPLMNQAPVGGRQSSQSSLIGPWYNTDASFWNPYRAMGPFIPHLPALSDQSTIRQPVYRDNSALWQTQGSSIWEDLQAIQAPYNAPNAPTPMIDLPGTGSEEGSEEVYGGVKFEWCPEDMPAGSSTQSVKDEERAVRPWLATPSPSPPPPELPYSTHPNLSFTRFDSARLSDGNAGPPGWTIYQTSFEPADEEGSDWIQPVRPRGATRGTESATWIFPQLMEPLATHITTAESWHLPSPGPIVPNEEILRPRRPLQTSILRHQSATAPKGAEWRSFGDTSIITDVPFNYPAAPTFGPQPHKATVRAQYLSHESRSSGVYKGCQERVSTRGSL